MLHSFFVMHRSRLVDKKANPGQPGDAKPRGQRGQPGYRRAKVSTMNAPVSTTKVKVYEAPEFLPRPAVNTLKTASPGPRPDTSVNGSGMRRHPAAFSLDAGSADEPTLLMGAGGILCVGRRPEV